MREPGIHAPLLNVQSGHNSEFCFACASSRAFRVECLSSEASILWEAVCVTLLSAQGDGKHSRNENDPEDVRVQTQGGKCADCQHQMQPIPGNILGKTSADRQ